MQTLELECPACSELLELDMGFAGGVCRCSACGTLMTVPQDAAAGAQAEQLSRPDRPDDPSGLSGMAESSEAVRPPRSRERASSRQGARGGKRNKGRAGKKGKSRGRGASRARERIEQGVYTTASGREVQIDRAMEVPTARSRRTGVRIATIAVFFSIIGVVTVIGAMAVVYMIQNPKGGKPVDPTENEPVIETDPTQFIYSASANPYLIDQANAIGLPLQGTVAIIFDAGDANDAWLSEMAEMIGTGLRRPGSEAKVLVMAADASGVRLFRDTAVLTTTVAPGPLVSFVEEGEGAGASKIDDAIDQAINITPDAIILIVGEPKRSEIDRWEEQLADYPDIAVHGVMVDGYSETFENWIYSRDDGRFISLVESDLLDWREEWAAEEDGDDDADE